MPIPVLLIDKSALVRDALRRMLESGGEYSVLEAANGQAALRDDRAGLMIMEIDLPDLNGADAIARILRRRPEVKLVVFSSRDDEQSVAEAIRAGACAYLKKTASHQSLFEALNAALHGESYFSPSIALRLVEIVRREVPRPASTARLEKLSPRERQILHLVSEGKTSKEAAAALNLTPHTVRSYRKVMMRKLSVTNAASLTRLALRWELEERR